MNTTYLLTLFAVFLFSMIVTFMYLVFTEPKDDNLRGTTSPKEELTDLQCRCMREESFRKDETDKGFCGYCLDGVRYACPDALCNETCSFRRFSGERCDSCRDENCMQ